MRLFRTRSVIVQAIQVTGFNDDALHVFCGEGRYRRHQPPRPTGWQPPASGIIAQVWSDTHDCWLGVRVGDWVERGPHDDLTPVRGEHTAARYQPLHG